MLNLLYFLKSLSFAIIALVIGAIAADELANRMERKEMRSSCYENSSASLSEKPNPMQDIMIRFQCRNAIP
jgi:hypothetical protein